MNSSFLKWLWKSAKPHILPIVVFLLVAVIYCQPALQGKVLNQHDVVGYYGMAKQSEEYKEKYGYYPLWTNSLFSGMPAYTIAITSKYEKTSKFLNNPTKYVFFDTLRLWLPNPADFFFYGCVCFYFLCTVLGLRSWLAVLGSLAFAYSSYSAIILAVGHESKMQALMVAPAVIASVLLLFQRKYLWGSGLLALFFSFQIGCQHLQVVYYTLIILGFFTVVQLIKSYKEGYLRNTIFAIILATVSGFIGFSIYAVSLLPIREYTEETMRGGRSELTKTNDPNATKDGLDKEYAFRWSYGVAETFTLLVPGVYGGGEAGREYKTNAEFVERMAEVGMPEENALQYVNAYSYWGDQPNTAGPVYVGAVICFLFIFGMVYLKSWHKWWIFAAVVIGILLAWGRHFSAFNYFLFDYLPMYNKFRAPSVSLVIPQLLMPLLSVLALDKLLNAQASRDELFKKFKQSLYVTGGLFVLLGLFYFSADFRGKNDTRIRDSFTQNYQYQLSQGQQPTPQVQQQAVAFGQSVVKALEEDRKSLFIKDYFRSLIFVVLAAVLLGLFIKNKLKPLPLMIGMLLLSTIDLLAYDVRYLNHDNFVEEDEFNSVFIPTAADQQILSDPAKPFRVFDQTDEQNGPFNSSRASYFHNSVGGYHPAKLGLYNDLIEYHLANMNLNVFNMLNTKYFMMNDPQTRQPVVQVNPAAFGPAWFVRHTHFVKNADEEIKALDSISLRDTVIVQESLKGKIPFQPQFDSAATIQVTEYLNDKITYKVSAATNQFAVFSEIYYPRGWNAFIDGKQTEHIKVNYALRGMAVPAGQHTIEFRFEPASYETGNTLMLIATILTFALLIAAIAMEVRKRRAGQGAPQAKTK